MQAWSQHILTSTDCFVKIWVFQVSGCFLASLAGRFVTFQRYCISSVLLSDPSFEDTALCSMYRVTVQALGQMPCNKFLLLNECVHQGQGITRKRDGSGLKQARYGQSYTCACMIVSAASPACRGLQQSDSACVICFSMGKLDVPVTDFPQILLSTTRPSCFKHRGRRGRLHQHTTIHHQNLSCPSYESDLC